MVNKDDRIQFLSNNTKVKRLKHAFEVEISTKKFIVKKFSLIQCSFFSTLPFWFIYLVIVERMGSYNKSQKIFRNGLEK